MIPAELLWILIALAFVLGIICGAVLEAWLEGNLFYHEPSATSHKPKQHGRQI